MKENTNTNNKKVASETVDNNQTGHQTDRVSNQSEAIDEAVKNDADIQAMARQYKREDNQRKVALLFSLMGNIFFLVTAYTILCYDTTGRLFGRLLGVNL